MTWMMDAGALDEIVGGMPRVAIKEGIPNWV